MKASRNFTVIYQWKIQVISLVIAVCSLAMAQEDACVLYFDL